MIGKIPYLLIMPH